VPTYQYRCTECGHAFEAVQSFSDEALTDCPVCTGRLRKFFSSVGIVFKGSGFYRTDSREKPASEGTAGTEKKDQPKEKAGAAASTTPPGGATSGSSSSSSSSKPASASPSNAATSKGSAA
jgi:putative FmdB family regulatory protein